MNTKCPKCQGEMEEGLIADKGHMNVVQPPSWGREIKWVFGIIKGGVKNPHEIKTYRCISCGFLESYAK